MKKNNIFIFTIVCFYIILLSGCTMLYNPWQETTYNSNVTSSPDPVETPTPISEPTSIVTPAPTDEITPAPTDEPTPDPTLDPTPDPTPDPTADPTPDPTAEPGGVFVKGINLNGVAVTIESNAWISYSDALSSGFSTTAGKTHSDSIIWSPSTDTDTNDMLNKQIYSIDASFTMTQTIDNGNYDLYFWIGENNSSNIRSIDIALEGITVATGIGSMELDTWVKYGPYNVTVSDGALDIEFVRVSFDSHCAGLAIFTGS